MYQTQCNSVESPALSLDLKASVLPKILQRDIVYAPLSLIGLNNDTLLGTQVKKHIYALMDHVSSKNTTGHHLRDLIKSHKIKASWLGSILSNNLPAHSRCITTSWISYTWKLTRDKNFNLEEGTARIMPQKQNDSFILEDFSRYRVMVNSQTVMSRNKAYVVLLPGAT